MALAEDCCGYGLHCKELKHILVERDVSCDYRLGYIRWDSVVPSIEEESVTITYGGSRKTDEVSRKVVKSLGFAVMTTS